MYENTFIHITSKSLWPHMMGLGILLHFGDSVMEKIHSCCSHENSIRKEKNNLLDKQFQVVVSAFKKYITRQHVNLSTTKWLTLRKV